jgi:uncharacterized membrane protein YfcA
MHTILETYSTAELLGIALSIFLLGMAKGGFPIGAIALPMLVLIWPTEAGGAKQVAGFMLPMLCTMDIIAVTAYRRHVVWNRVLRLIPASIAGVALASVLFLFGDTLVSLSDRWLKLMIGAIGILFVLYQSFRKLILKKLEGSRPSWKTAGVFGFVAGITSTLAHAGGPVAQMYFLPQDIPKMGLAGSMAAFFFLLNLIKVVPYAISGQFSGRVLLLGALVLPVIPLGVFAGYRAVRLMKGDSYRVFIYLVLLVTSTLLIAKAITTG